MDLVCKEELLKDCLEEMKPMLVKHWDELANNKDIRPLNPDYETYLCLSEIGILKVFTVRLEGVLIGYSSWMVTNNLHYKDWKYAVCDVYYLNPDYRKTGISLDFFFKTEDWLKGLGVKSITVQDKINHSHAKFFDRLGFKPIEQNYEKVI